MDPETVSGLEIGDLGDGKSGACALNANLDFRTNEVEGGIVGVSCAKEERDGKTCGISLSGGFAGTGRGL